MIRLAVNAALCAIAAVAIFAVLWIVVVITAIGVTVLVVTAPFRRYRFASLHDRRVVRADDTRSFTVLDRMPAACCCQACGWSSSN